MTLSASAAPADLSTLAWVVDELRRTLDNAHKALRRQTRELEAAAPGSGVDAAALAPLQQARSLFHQGAGALDMVGQVEGARLLRACEQAVQVLAQEPLRIDAAAVQTVERASFALLDFLGRRLAGKEVSPLALFPQYRDVQTLAGADRVHPADLWQADPQRQGSQLAEHGQALGQEATASGVTALQPDSSTRNRMEQCMLALLRGPAAPAAEQMSTLFAGLAAGAAAPGTGKLAGIWSVAAGFFEAQAQGRLVADVYAKRLTSRLLAQVRLAERGQSDVSDRLTQDLLFFCARVPGDAGDAADSPRLAAVRRAFAISGQGVVDYEQEALGRYDPALAPLARRRVEGLKESWSSVTSGQSGLAPSLREQVALVGDSVRKLHPEGDRFARALESAVAQVADSGTAPSPGLAMEVATSLLCLDAALADADIHDDSFGPHIQQLADRVDLARQGRATGPIEPWMEDLYRRASDRQTMGSVVQELRSSLAEVEQQLDKFNRHPDDRDPLIPVPAKLSAMRGVLSVLGLDHAGQAVLRMRDEVDGVLAQPRGADESEAATRRLSDQAIGRLATNVGALGFLIDLLGVQPLLAKSLFRFDADSGRLETVMGRSEAPAPDGEEDAAATPAAFTPATPPLAGESQLMEHVQSLAQVAGDGGASKSDLMHKLEELTQQAVASDERALAEAAKAARSALAHSEGEADTDAVRQDLAQAMTDYAAPPPAVPVQATAVVSATATSEDDEMLDVFFEEAEEVIAGSRDSLATLAQDPQHFESLSTVRRAFHTLKGSSRMVGLRDFGDAAWACEQLYNARLAETVIEADAPLREFSLRALAELERWVQALVARDAAAFHSAPLVRAANALRDGDDAGAQAMPLTSLPPSADREPLPAHDAEATQILDDLLDAGTGPVDAAEALDDDVLHLDLPDIDDANDGSDHARTVPAALGEPEVTEEPAFEIDLSALDVVDLPDTDTVMAEPELASPAEAIEVIEVIEVIEPAPGVEPFLEPAASGQAGDDADTPVPENAEPHFATVPVSLDELASFDALPTERTAAPAANDAGMTSQDAEPDASEDALPADDAENYKVVGPLRIGLGLFNIFLNEADEQSRRLCTALAEWALELPRPVGEEAVALAHSLAGNSATVGHVDLSALARRLEHALGISMSHHVDAAEATLYGDVAEEIRRLLHQFAAGFLRSPMPALIERFDAFEAEAHTQAALTAHEDHVRSLREAQVAQVAQVAPADQGADAPGVAVAAEAVEAAEAAEPASADPALADPAPDDPAPADTVDFPDERIAAAEVIESPDAQAIAEEFAALQAGAQAPTAQPREHSAAPAAREHVLGAVRFSALDDLVPPSGVQRVEVDPSGVDASSFSHDLDAQDAIDPELFEIFSEEAHELLPSLAAHLRAWEESPDQPAEAFGALRALHTLKGSARLAGAMRLGELAHRLESAFEARVGGRVAVPPTMTTLHEGVDALHEEFQRLTKGANAARPQAVLEVGPADAEAAEAASTTATAAAAAAAAAGPASAPAEPAPADESAASETTDLESTALETTALEKAPHDTTAPEIAAPTVPISTATVPATIDWARFDAENPSRGVRAPVSTLGNPATATVRVKAPLLDRLVNQAGEVSITRSRIETDVTQMRVSLRELTENLDRLRRQLRDIELQADTQIASRLEASKSASVEFDPLEMDRFTRFQELTRMMAESVNDVATVQRSLQQTVQSAEDEMAAQARLTRALQEDLLRARMVPFDTLSERLYRVVRQAAKETAVQVRLNIDGSAIELDRSVLDRVAGAFEHLLRNAVVHGIESADIRRALDKDPVGTIDVVLTQQGNEVRIQIRDDGHGLDLPRIEARGRRHGLISADAQPSDAELANLIFVPGFTTAEEVTELAGRGVGMDAVRSDVTALGGRIETASAPGRGTAFTLLLPLTTAVTRVVQLRSGALTVAMPASLVEVVRRVPVDEVERAYLSGVYRDGAVDLPFFWLGALLQSSAQGVLAGRTTSVVLVRSAEQRVALHVDQVVGNQEVVVKNLGPQLARLPGLAGMSLLASGDVVPIYNPVALAAVYGQRRVEAAPGPVPLIVEAAPEVGAPLILVVDDSLTVRRVTQRLLVREGFRVTVAKDGLDALEQLEVERPVVMLTDIEMPRMDGFDLLRNVRHDRRWQDLPVIMITSRIAQKHRDLAQQLGADHYLGKPYDEDQLIALIRENVARVLHA